MIFHALKICLFFILVSCVFGTKRKIQCFDFGVNTNSKNGSDINLVHVIADGPYDTIHYLWSSYKRPSILVARTINDTELKVNLTELENFSSDAIKFTREPLEVIGITISELWELHYPNDSVEISKWTSLEALDLDLFHWNGTLSCSDTSVNFTLKSHGDITAFSSGGTVEIQLYTTDDEESLTDISALIFTGNSTLMKVIFQNLHSNVSETRYGLNIILASTLSAKCSSDDWETESSKSISDEFSPGVFSFVQLLPKCQGANEVDKSFISWLPVAYTGEVPIVANSSDASMTSECEQVNVASIKSIAELCMQGKTNFSSFNLTFGTQGDGFYHKTKYTSWSCMTGIGSPLKSELSSTAIIFISVGLGALVLFFLSGALFILFKQFYKRDDDLLLSDSSMN